MDFGFTGPRFTWTNNRVGDKTWERLDRVVVTSNWLLLFPSARVHHLEGWWSDHKPIWVGTEPMVTPTLKPFQFEEVWSSDQGCENAIAQSWKTNKDGVPMFKVWDKIDACRRGLRAWSKHSFGSIKSQTWDIELHLKQAEENSMQGWDHNQVREIKTTFHALLRREERIWCQRSHVKWLKVDDCNTRYFHCWATQRNRINYIHRLKDWDGRWTTSQD